MARTPVLPEATAVGALSAGLRRPRQRSATARVYLDSSRGGNAQIPVIPRRLCQRGQIDPSRTFRVRPMNGWQARESDLRPEGVCCAGPIEVEINETAGSNRLHWPPLLTTASTRRGFLCRSHLGAWAALLRATLWSHAFGRRRGVRLSVKHGMHDQAYVSGKYRFARNEERLELIKIFDTTIE